MKQLADLFVNSYQYSNESAIKDLQFGMWLRFRFRFVSLALVVFILFMLSVIDSFVLVSFRFPGNYVETIVEFVLGVESVNPFLQSCF